MATTLRVTISDNVNEVLEYCCKKYKCTIDDLIEDAIREYYIEERYELRKELIKWKEVR